VNFAKKHLAAHGANKEYIPIYSEHIRLLKVAGYDVSAWDRPPLSGDDLPLPDTIHVLVRERGGHRRIDEVQLADGTAWIARIEAGLVNDTHEIYHGDPETYRVVYIITAKES
jgi:hypothetical protein